MKNFKTKIEKTRVADFRNILSAGKKTQLMLMSIAVFTLFSCGLNQGNEESSDENMDKVEDTTNTTAATSEAEDDLKKAVAVIHSNDMNLDAWVTFTETDEGVRVEGRFEGLPEGMHAYHIHVCGDCRADDYSSAGPHFVFHPPAPENAPIVGNLGEFSANRDGVATTDTIIEDIEIEDIIGRAVVIHEKGNNLNPPPTGNAGSRIACGVIGRANTGEDMEMDMEM